MMKFLLNFSNRLNQHRWERYLFLFVLTLLAILISGYYFGTFDQVIHIPFLKKFADPTLYPADPFLDVREVHYSFFWLLFLPVYRLGVLEPVMFLIHVLSTFGMFIMAWALIDALFKKPLASLLGVIMLVFPHIGLSGFQFIEFSLLNRTFALPFILGALILYLRKKTLFAFLLLGLMYNIHVVYVNFAMAMVLMDCLIQFKKGGWKNLLLGLGMFLIGAAPILIWRSNSVPVDLSVRPDILQLSGSALLAGVYYMFSTNPIIWVNTLQGAATFAFFVLGRRLNISKHDQTMTNFMVGIGVVLVVQLVTTYFLPIVFILQLQILRIGVFLQIIGYVYFAGYLAHRYERHTQSEATSGIITAAYMFYLSPIVPLLLSIIHKWFDKIRWRQVLVSCLLIILQVVTIYVAIRAGLLGAKIEIYGPKTAWTEAQIWAKENTPKEAMFITPPHILSHYEPDWRVFSERGTFAELVEIFEFPQPEYITGWQTRFEMIAPGAIAQFNGNYFDTFRVTKEAYYRLHPEAFLNVATQYDIRYLVMEKPYLQPFPIVYENAEFVIYDLLNAQN